MNALLELASHGHVAPAQVDLLGLRLGLLPDAKRWRHMLERTLLAAAALLVACGLIFFIAANWGALDRYGKLALAQLAIVVGVGLYWRFGDARAGRVGLGFSVLSLGALLALYGQTYQTGADAYQLFAAWAALSVAWVWLAAHPALWLGWLVLVDIALLRWFSFRPNFWGGLDETGALVWVSFFLHAGLLALVEGLARRGSPLAAARYPRYLLLFVALGAISALALRAVFDADARFTGLVAVLYLASLAAVWFRYRVQQVDILPLAMACLSGIALVTSLVVKAFGDNAEIGMLFVATLVVVGLTGAAGTWLLRVSRGSQEAS